LVFVTSTSIAVSRFILEDPGMLQVPNFADLVVSVAVLPLVVAAYSFGSGSRTEPSLRNPGTFGFDAVLSRWQPITEHVRLQFRAEFYNMLNHPNLGAPSASITSSTFGVITTKSGNRSMVMALRLVF